MTLNAKSAPSIAGGIENTNRVMVRRGDQNDTPGVDVGVPRANISSEVSMRDNVENRASTALLQSAKDFQINDGHITSVSGECFTARRDVNVTNHHHYHHYNSVPDESREREELEILTQRIVDPVEVTCPLAPLPIQRDCDIYFRHMASKGHGIPLYIPEPSKNLPLQYQRKGISIGDVIKYEPSGSSTFLFNICLPHDHPINPPILPKDFKPLYLAPLNISVHSKFKENSYLASASTVRSQSNAGSTGLIFESSERDGAILAMPVGSRSEDLLSKRRFSEYLDANIINWYKYVYHDLGIDIKNGELRLVTGHDKTTSWGMATFSNSVARQESFHLEFGLLEGRKYGWECSGMGDVRIGPDGRDLRELRDNDPMQEGVCYENQCLFVRTLNPELPDKVWDELGFDTEKVDIDPHSPTPDSSFLFGHGCGGQSTSGGSSSASPPPNHTNGTNSSRKAWNDSIATVYAARSGYPSPKYLADHPSKAINSLLLENCSEKVKMVITRDQDWISVLKEDDFVLPSSEELLERIKASFTICEEEGIVFLAQVEECLCPSEDLDNGPPLFANKLESASHHYNVVDEDSGSHFIADTAHGVTRGSMLELNSKLDTDLNPTINPNTKLVLSTNKRGTHTFGAEPWDLKQDPINLATSSGPIDKTLQFPLRSTPPDQSMRPFHRQTPPIEEVGQNTILFGGTNPSLICMEDLDRDTWGSNDEVLYPAPQFQHKGLSSLTLLAACAACRFATGCDEYGRFSNAFLNLLKVRPPDEIRYLQILSLMDPIKCQNPQIEEVDLDRFLFDAAPHTPLPPAHHILFFDKDLSLYLIVVGTAHGVTDGTIFDVMSDSGPNTTQMGTLTVQKSMASHSLVKSCNDGLALPTNPMSAVVVMQRKADDDIGEFLESKFLDIKQNHLMAAHLATDWPSTAGIDSIVQKASGQFIYASTVMMFIASQNVRPGVRPRPFHLYIAHQGNNGLRYQTLHKYLRSLLGNIKYGLDNIVVDNPEETHLKVSVSKNKATFQPLEGRLAQYNHYFQLPLSSDTMASALESASDFRWQLDHTNEDDSDLMDDIDISVYSLEERLVTFANDSLTEMMPINDKDLCENNVLDFALKRDLHLGFKITNTGDRGLYPVLQYFNFGDMGKITTLYQPPTSGPYLLEAPLKEDGGCLTVGYGAGGMPPLVLSLQQGQDITIGYLKLSVFTQPPDLGLVGTQFQRQYHDLSEDTWVTRIIPVIQRRHSVQTPIVTTPLSSRWQSLTQRAIHTYPEAMANKSISTPTQSTLD